jgi:hypothetical protein
MSMSVEAKILIPADIWLAVDEMAGATGKLVSEVIVDVLRESMARTGREALGRESIDATGWAEAAFDGRGKTMREILDIWEADAKEIVRKGDFSHNAYIQQAIARG